MIIKTPNTDIFENCFCVTGLLHSYFKKDSSSKRGSRLTGLCHLPSVTPDTRQTSRSFEADIIAESKEPKKNEGKRIREDFSEDTKNYKIYFTRKKINSSSFKIRQIKLVFPTCNMAFVQVRIRPWRLDSGLPEDCGEKKSPAVCLA